MICRLLMLNGDRLKKVKNIKVQEQEEEMKKALALAEAEEEDGRGQRSYVIDQDPDEQKSVLDAYQDQQAVDVEVDAFDFD